MNELTMNISGICNQNGKKMAYVTFLGEDCRAEGTIPDCKITSSEGFSEEEVGQLELYLKMNLSDLKKRAAAINPVKAMFSDRK